MNFWLQREPIGKFWFCLYHIDILAIKRRRVLAFVAKTAFARVASQMFVFNKNSRVSTSSYNSPILISHLNYDSFSHPTIHLHTATYHTTLALYLLFTVFINIILYVCLQHLYYNSIKFYTLQWNEFWTLFLLAIIRHKITSNAIFRIEFLEEWLHT